MFLQNLMGASSSTPFGGLFLFGGLVLIIYVVTSRRRLKKLQDKIPDSPQAETERDVLGMEKEIPKGIEHFTSLDKVMQWKVVLLVVLMIIGLYLVVFQRPTINKDTGPVKSYIEQGPID